MGACMVSGQRSLKTNPREIPSFESASQTSMPRGFQGRLSNRPCRKNPRNQESAGSAPDIPNREARRKWIVGIDNIIGDARDPGAPADRRDDSGVRANPRFCDQLASECRPEDSLVHKILV